MATLSPRPAATSPTPGPSLDEIATRARTPGGDRNVLGRLVRLARRADELEVAAEALTERHHAEPDDADVLALLVQVLESCRRWKEALTHARRLCALAPDATRWYVVGRLAARLGLNEEADAAYDHCLELSPGDRRARHGRAALLSRRRDWVGALDLIDGLLADDPDDQIAWRQSVALRLRQDRVVEAVDRIADAAVRFPGRNGILDLTTVLGSAGLVEEVDRLQEDLLADDNLADEYLHQIGRSAVQRSAIDVAVRAYGRLIEPRFSQRQDVRDLARLAAMLSAVEGGPIAPDSSGAMMALTRFAVRIARSGAVPAPAARANRSVVMIIASLGAGGAERQFLTTALGLAGQGLAVRVIAPDAEADGIGGFFRAPLERAGITVDQPNWYASAGDQLAHSRLGSLAPLLDALPGSEGRRLAAFAETLAADLPDVVQAWQDATGVLGAIAALLTGVPRVVINTRSLAPDHKIGRERPYLRQVYRELLQLPQVTLSNNSRTGADDYRRWLDMPDLVIPVVPNGLDLDARDSNPEDVAETCASLGIAPETPVIGGVMRLTEEKQPYLWLETVAGLLETRREFHAVLVGDGPMRWGMAEWIANCRLDGRIHLVGHKKNVQDWYALFRILILTSRIEGTPNVLIEAQAQGVPVVTTNAGGARHTLEDGVTGHLVKVHTAPALAAAAARLLDDVEGAAARREACRAFAQANFGAPAMIARTLGVLFPEV